MCAQQTEQPELFGKLCVSNNKDGSGESERAGTAKGTLVNETME